jgi:hypothetical protein
MAPMQRRSGVGPLFVQTGASPRSNEEARTPRTARCKTMSRHECVKPLITNDMNSPRVLSIERVSAFPVSSTTPELKDKQEHKVIDPTLAFESVSSGRSQSNFEELRVSSLKSRLTRSSSITTCVVDLLRAPSMIHRTPPIEMLEDFQKLEVQSDATDNMPSMFYRPTSTQMHEDCQKLKVQGSQTLDHGLFHPRSSLFLVQDIEIYD